MDFSSVQGNIWSFEIFGKAAYYLAVVYHSCAVHILYCLAKVKNRAASIPSWLQYCIHKYIVKVKHVVYIKDWNQEII